MNACRKISVGRHSVSYGFDDRVDVGVKVETFSGENFVPATGVSQASSMRGWGDIHQTRDFAVGPCAHAEAQSRLS